MMNARIVQSKSGDWNLEVDGSIVMEDESFTVCSNTAEAINHPEWWEPTEAYEVADRLREAK